MHPAHPTEVSEQCVVALTWTLKDTLGEVLDVLEAPVEFLVGGDDLLTRIDQALQGHAVGDTLQLHLEPEDAFGDYDEQRVFLSARSAFPETLEEGMTFDGLGLPANACPDAPPELLYTITEIYPEHVVLDGNHPLAGVSLVFACTVSDVRAATAEEIEHGHAHGDGGDEPADDEVHGGSSF